MRTTQAPMAMVLNVDIPPLFLVAIIILRQSHRFRSERNAVSTIEENIGIDSSGMNDVLFRFREPEGKRRAKKILVRFHIGAVIILVVSSYLSYINGMMNSMIIFALGAAFIGGHALWSMHKDSCIGNIGLIAKGIVFFFTSRVKQKAKLEFAPYDMITSIRVPNIFKSLRLYMMTLADGRRFLIDGWIESELFEKLREQLGERWDSVFTPSRPLWRR